MKSKRIKKSSSPSQNNDLIMSDFHTAVAKIAVAQICQSVGFKGAQTSALETLTDVAIRYLRSLAKSAATFAVSTGRTQCNLPDIIRAMVDLHTDIGFNGNSNPNAGLLSLTDSSLLCDTIKFVYWSREIPFSKPLSRRRHTIPSSPPLFSCESPKWNHIPRWLPAFPKMIDGGEKPVVGTESEKRVAWTSEISKLPEKRKKVSFKIGGGGSNEIQIGCEVDLRSKVGKCEDEKFLNHDAKPSMKELEGSSSRRMIMMH